MANVLVFLSDLQTGRSSSIVEVRLLCFREAMNVRRGGEIMRVDMLLWDSQVSDSYMFQRFMIYVHAKGIILDNEYVLMGSANINQRSMAGTKDTEIAMGAYQPHHTWTNKGRHPRGQVYGYRMSLWAEHLGETRDEFVEPADLRCVKNVNEISEGKWKKNHTFGILRVAKVT